MSLATREQKAVVTDFAGDGRFLITFSSDEKVMRERLDYNISERLRLSTAIESKTSKSESPRLRGVTDLKFFLYRLTKLFA